MTCFSARHLQNAYDGILTTDLKSKLTNEKHKEKQSSPMDLIKRLEI